MVDKIIKKINTVRVSLFDKITKTQVRIVLLWLTKSPQKHRLELLCCGWQDHQEILVKVVIGKIVKKYRLKLFSYGWQNNWEMQIRVVSLWLHDTITQKKYRLVLFHCGWQNHPRNNNYHFSKVQLPSNYEVKCSLQTSICTVGHREKHVHVCKTKLRTNAMYNKLYMKKINN